MIIRHLATCDIYVCMKFDFRVAHNTIPALVKYAIINVYKDECIQCLSTVAE